MTMADMLKLCTLHESSCSNLASKLGPQVVGVLSVLALSGSAVALIGLAASRGKLQRQSEALMHEDEDEDGDEDGDGDRGEGEDEAEAEEEEQEAAHMQECLSHRIRPQDKAQLAPSIIKPCSSTRGTKCSPNSQQKKRVRFAPDVVDPPGNGHLYRSSSTHITIIRKASAPQQQQKATRSACNIPANRLALYKGLRQSKLQHSLRSF